MPFWIYLSLFSASATIVAFIPLVILVERERKRRRVRFEIISKRIEDMIRGGHEDSHS